MAAECVTARPSERVQRGVDAAARFASREEEAMANRFFAWKVAVGVFALFAAVRLRRRR